MGLTVHRLREELAPFRHWPLRFALAHLVWVLAAYGAGFYAALAGLPWPTSRDTRNFQTGNTRQC